MRVQDLYALGIGHHKLRLEVARGTVVRLRQGVYVAADELTKADPRTIHLLRAMAEQVADPRLVASHGTAAVCWQLPLLHEEQVVAGVPMLTVPPGGGQRSRVRGTARVRVAELPGHHVVVHPGGLTVTSRSRTAVDVARGALPDQLAVIDAAVRAESLAMPMVRRRRDLANPRIRAAALAPVTEAAAFRGRLASLAAAFALADPRRETPIESLTAAHIHVAGLPQPIPQAAIRVPGQTVYPDFLWPDQRLIGEADGAVKYDTAAVMLAEKRREQALRDLGFRIVRWLGKEIRVTPWVVVDRIARALDAAVTT